MKFVAYRLVGLTGVFLGVLGCGGGGSAGGGLGSSGVENQFGSITTRTAGAIPPPVIMGSRSAVFTGVGGANFTDVKLRMPPLANLSTADALAQTSIVGSSWNRPVFYDYGTGQLKAIGPNQRYSDDCTPNIAPVGTRLVASQIDPTQPRLDIFSMALDGSSRILVASDPANFCEAPTYSPDGAKVAFVKAARIWVVPSGGGVQVALTPAPGLDANPVWSPDGTLIAFSRYDSGTSKYNLWTMKPDGTNPVMLVNEQSDVPIQASWQPGTGNLIITANHAGTYSLNIVNPVAYDIALVSGSDYLGSPSWAPTGDRFVYQLTAVDPAVSGNYVYDMTSKASTRVTDGSITSPSWGPYLAARVFVGSGGTFGTTAGAILFGQVGKRVNSFLAFDATTRSSIQIIPQQNPNPYQTIVVCTVTADSLTSLKYMTDIRGSAIALVTPTTAVSGAIVTFSADTGEINTISPYIGTVSSTGGKFTGRFTGVWDAKGKNLAPSGAASVAFNPTSGAPTIH